MQRLATISAAFLSLALLVTSARADRPDHIVIVIEENHGYSQIIGNSAAPYINQLAANGANFSLMYAITHPSQPNYLHLFSGSAQGNADDNPPVGYPFSTPNLGAELLAAGLTFAGYSEDLPAVGSNVTSSGSYMRKHNPWVNWQVDPPGVNQVPSTVNLPFTYFPSDYTQLPDVAIVVPNQLNDMHDGTIAQADAWLQTNIGPYAAWAMTHNSLLIVTFDEDEGSELNRIATIFYGPMVRTGNVSSVFTLHNLLRTIEQLKGTTHAAAASQVRPMIGCFAEDPQVIISRFIQGSAGYTGVTDAYIEATVPTAAHGADTMLVVDGSPLSQGLIRFDNVFGNAPGQVPQGSLIASAKLLMMTGSTSGDQSATQVNLHRLLVDWNGASTWNSLAGGVSTDNVEALATPEFSVIPSQLNNWVIFDVTGSVQTWSYAPTTNHGWLFQPLGTDGWRVPSSDNATLSLRPALEITRYACPGDFDGDHTVTLIDVSIALANYGATRGDLRYIDGDLDGNGAIDLSDLAIELSLYGTVCP